MIEKMKTVSKYIQWWFCLSFVLLSFISCEDESKGGFTPEEPDMVLDFYEKKVSKNGDFYSLSITSNLPWRAQASEDWILISDSTMRGGASDHLLSFDVKKNQIEKERKGVIKVWITDDYYKEILIIQEEGDPAPMIKKSFYVKEGATGDGLSWATAMSLDMALKQDLVSGDTIHIAAGTYQPGSCVTGGSEAASGDRTFEIKGNIVLLGGYPSNAKDKDMADCKSNLVILDGNGVDHVVTITAPLEESNKVEIKGIIITKGKSTAAASEKIRINGMDYIKAYGGGLIIGQSVVEMESCEIVENETMASAGGIYLFNGAKLSLKNCVVQRNKSIASNANGGGIWANDRSILELENTIISDNASGGFAGGCYIYKSTLTAFNCFINGNGAGGIGSTVSGKHYGGVYLREGDALMVNCTLYGNTASANGAGIGVYGTAASSATFDLISCTITSNEVNGQTALGAGIYVNGKTDACTVNLFNTIVSGNKRGTEILDVNYVAGGKTYNKNSIIGLSVYTAQGEVVSEVTFDPVSMLSSLKDPNGFGYCSLLGNNNPARNFGLASDDLILLGDNFDPVIPKQILTYDQKGNHRSLPVMGAYVGD